MAPIPGYRGWDEGTDAVFLADLVTFWRDEFDWRAQERALNQFAHFRAGLDGAALHFVHERGRGPRPLPLILTHGWPSTFYELLPLVPLLTDPASHGGNAADSFDVVIPSLPGYPFSDPLDGPGSANHIPGRWDQLMRDVLGYQRYGAHGGDIGAMVTNRLAWEYPAHLVGIHVALAAEPSLAPPAPPLSQAERAMLAERAAAQETDGAYAHLQRTRPQTLAYALTDSPAGLAAWILDKWQAWSDCGGNLETCFTKDDLLTTVMLFWVTRTICTSFQVYRDWALGTGSQSQAWRGHNHMAPGVERPLPPGQLITVPAAMNLREARHPREWAERSYSDLRRFTTLPRGGHFAAREQPELLAADIRAFFNPLR